MLIGAGAKVGCTHLLLHRSPDAVVDAWGPLHLPPFYFRRMLSPHRRRFFEARFFFGGVSPFGTRVGYAFHLEISIRFSDGKLSGTNF